MEKWSTASRGAPRRAPLPGSGIVGPSQGAGNNGDDGDIARTIVREPGSATPEEYAGRVRKLAATYFFLFFGSIAGVLLLVTQGQLFVTLAQRSNVETLALAFLLFFFSYIAIISVKGAIGAVRIFWWAALTAMTRDRLGGELRKMRALGRGSKSHPSVGLNVLVEREGRPGNPIELQVGDGAGSMGSLIIDGARVTYLETRHAGSNNLFAFLHHQLNQLLERRALLPQVDVVAWKTVDDEATEEYLSIVQFARNLEAYLGAPKLWPKVELTDSDCEELEQLLSQVCPALREEAFLPDWEYSAEHKLPIIPEPLGFVTLSRSERRVDPLASMGCAVMVVGVLVVLLGLFTLIPPWVPGI